MSYLIYCVLNGRRGPARPSLRGVGGQVVWVLECGGLCAAVSEASAAASGAPAVVALQLDASQLNPAQMDDLLTYAKVIEAFNRAETVVPMRYGCRFETIAAIRAWVAGRRPELCQLLGRLEGRVEMGVRILLAQAALARPVAPAVEPLPGPPAAPSPGAAYLAARRRELACQDRQEDCLERAAQALRTELCALARECVVEAGWSGQRMVASLYFLVEKAALPGFRAAFSRVASRLEAPALLSGPWPPYNFVCAAGPAAALGCLVSAAAPPPVPCP